MDCHRCGTQHADGVHHVCDPMEPRRFAISEWRGVIPPQHTKEPSMTEVKPPPKPGLYEDVSFDDYLRWPYVNNSSLKAVLRSPAHYQAYLRQPRNEPSDALRFGTFAHAGKLEPIHVAARYVVMPAFEDQVRREDGTEFKNPKGSAAYKELVAEFERVNADKELVSQADFDKLCGMLDALRANSRAREYFDHNGPAEVTMVWDDPTTGIRCKGRIDKLDEVNRRAADLKTTQDAADFSRSISKFGYHRQGAFYVDGLEALTGARHEFCLVAVEKEFHYGVRSAPLSADAIAVGRAEYRKALDRIAACRVKEEWPGYDDPESWTLPPRAFHSSPVPLNVAGELVTL